MIYIYVCIYLGSNIPSTPICLLQAAWSCMQCGIVSAIAGTAFAQPVAHGRQLPG